MTDLRLEQALVAARTAAQKAGRDLKPHFGDVGFSKHGTNAVSVFTELDRRTEKFLEVELGKFSSEIGFIGEEFGVQSKADITWLVDPIDGTGHFIRGLPFCQVMIALVEKGQVVLSVIHNIADDNTYWAVRGKGAFRDDGKISVSSRGLADSIIAFETRMADQKNYEVYLALSKRANSINFLTSGFEFCMIASGKLDGKVALNPYGQDWDFAPGSLLVSEAGGVAANIGAKGYAYANHDFLITNPTVFKELTQGNAAIFPLA